MNEHLILTVLRVIAEELRAGGETARIARADAPYYLPAARELAERNGFGAAWTQRLRRLIAQVEREMAE